MAKKEKQVRIYSALEVARICGVVNQTAINWIKNGHLKAFQTPGGQYRVYAEDLVSFLTSRGMRVPADLAGGEEVQPDRDLVLIVDDDPQINTLLMRFLQKKDPGRRIIQAFDGFEAGRLISERRPEALVLDIGLPGLDGHGLCRRIKQDASLARPVIVAISGLDQGAEGAVIIEEGADAFFAKPLDLERLEARLRELFATARRDGLDPAGFRRLRNRMQGSLLRSLDSLEHVGYTLLSASFRGLAPFEELAVVDALTLGELQARLEEHVVDERIAVAVALPDATG